MTRQVTENGLRQALMAQINSLIEEIEKEESTAEDESESGMDNSTKKNDPDTFLTETS